MQFLVTMCIFEVYSVRKVFQEHFLLEKVPVSSPCEVGKRVLFRGLQFTMFRSGVQLTASEKIVHNTLTAAAHYCLFEKSDILKLTQLKKYDFLS